LEREYALLNRLGSPDKKLKIIHIAGTNGKGGTAAYITQILVAAGKKVGTFMSPQVYSFYDQFLLGGKPIAKNAFDPYISLVESLSADMEDKPSPFEKITAAAICAFYKEGCEYAVLECGLGGRDDATNAVAKKEAAVITSVSLEHTAELGSTITEICKAKGGIIKNCPFILSALNGEEAFSYFKTFSPVIAGAGIKAEGFDTQSLLQKFSYGGKTYSTHMLGAASPYNAACAIEACRALKIDEKYFEEGISAANLPGRMEVIKSSGRAYVLDGAHNPAAIEKLTQALSLFSGEKQLAFGCLSDKDVTKIAKKLSPNFKKAFLFSPQSPRAMDIKDIEGAFCGLINYKVVKSVSQALSLADSPVVVVCGSFTILKEAKDWIEKRR